MSALKELSDCVRNILENRITKLEESGYFLSKEECGLLLLGDDSLHTTDFEELLAAVSRNPSFQRYPLYPLYHSLAMVIKSWIDSRHFPIIEMQQFALLNENQSDESKFGIVCKAEPFIQNIRDHWDALSSSARSEYMSELLQALGKRGLLSLLGVRHTVGSVEVFPPPLSALWKSFNLKQNEKSNLTVGARALSKHCHRDATLSWWGICTGSEQSKNDHANSVLIRILSSSAWVNIHHLPHEVVILEVRHSEGYGARWSVDGNQFRGFLEPQMEEGHSSKWRH